MFDLVIKEYTLNADKMDFEARKQFHKCLKFAVSDMERGNNEIAEMMLALALNWIDG